MSTRRISRKALAKMSTLEFLRAAWTPYKRLLSYLKPYKVRFGWGIFFGALYGMTNGVLIWTIKEVCAAVFPGQGGEGFSLFTKAVPAAPAAAAGHAVSFETVLIACLTVPAIMLFRGAFSYLNSYCLLWVSQRVLNDIRRELFDRLLSQSLEFFNKSKTGDLIQTVFNQTRMAQMALTTVASDVIKQPISILSAIVALVIIDWKFTIGAMLLFPACLVPVMVIGKKIRRAGTDEEREAGALMVVMHEAFAGIRLVKSHAHEDYEAAKFNKANETMLAMMMRWQKAMQIVGPLVETVASFGVAFALAYAWWLNLGAPAFLALQGGLVLLYPPFKTLSRLHILMQKTLSATTGIFELMDREPAVTNASDAVPLERCRGDVAFEQVSFAYVKKIPAVRRIDLKIPAGSTCALVGPSGAGKSTLLWLLLRFYDPSEGRISIDGRDIRGITLKSLRENISIVSQDTFLFHDTILHNIRYGRLDATVEEVQEAARQAFAHEFILAQQHGYETIIGDKGCLLSGGQQQRLAIARALLKNAPILLLDEATSALDTESEQKIQLALDTLSQGRTVIAIAHRLSTILKADTIVVMDHGKIVGVGPHQELLETSPIYRRLYDLQFNRSEAVEAELIEPTPNSLAI